MNCPYCGTDNSDYEHRCTHCSRRLRAVAPRPVPDLVPASRSSPAQRYEPAPQPAVAPPRVAEAPRIPAQPSLFGPKELPKVIPFEVHKPRPAAERETSTTTAAPRRRVERDPSGEQQPMLSFNKPLDGKRKPPPADTSIYCDAPVASPMHRALAAAIDFSMVMISIGIFLLIFHFAGAEIILNKITLPFYGAFAAGMTTFYYGFWRLAGQDSIGLRCARLRLVTFDGYIPARGQRLYRMVAALLSLTAGGLGLLWALVDEEQLTWHDHMSKTFPTTDRRK